MSEKPPHWKMVKEAVEELGGSPSNKEIIAKIEEKYQETYGELNEGALRDTIVMCSVNNPNRIHYNKKPRLATNPNRDFLYSLGKGTGKVEIFDRDKHGDWEITRDDNDNLIVAQIGDNFEEKEEREEERSEETGFAYENHLRDYLVSNLSIIEPGLILFSDKQGNKGIEYPVDSNYKRIDILALDKNQCPVVIELKVSQGYEKVIGQCLYYKNRIKQIFSSETVRIIIVAWEITPQLRIATEDLPGVELFEYKIAFTLKKVL